MCPRSRLERIFERYYSERRADAAGEVADEAAAAYFGIGLWIARRNVEAMGGTIVAPRTGSPHGLQVHIRLPLAPGRG